MQTILFSYLFNANIDWAVCGGYAIDIFVGHKTRDHKDIDIAVFWDQRDNLLGYLLQRDWRIFEPEGGLLREVTCLDDDLKRNDNLWCISRETTAYQIDPKQDNFFYITTLRKHQDSLDFIEFLFNKRVEDQFIYKRNPNIRHDKAILHDNSGIPYLAPEIVLLYKSIFVRYIDSPLSCDIDMVNCYRHDFEVAFPLLDKKQKQWLASALNLSYPNGHEWLSFIRMDING